MELLAIIYNRLICMCGAGVNDWYLTTTDIYYMREMFANILTSSIVEISI